jgi:hypothetical protein
MYRFPANGKWTFEDWRIEKKSWGNWAMGMLPDSYTEDKRTMNLFAIDSLNELREDKLG